MFKLPDSAKQLVDELDRMFPERIPDAGASEAEMQRYYGKRELVLLLKSMRDRKVR